MSEADGIFQNNEPRGTQSTVRTIYGVSECMVIGPYASEMSAEQSDSIVCAIIVFCYLYTCMNTDLCCVLQVYIYLLERLLVFEFSFIFNQCQAKTYKVDIYFELKFTFMH